MKIRNLSVFIGALMLIAQAQMETTKKEKAV